MRILICDDENAILRVTEMTLVPRGHEVMKASGSAEAIGIFEKSLIDNNPFDLVITDVSMPGDSGFYFAGVVRTKGYDGRMAVMTGCEADLVNLSHLGAEYWFKPDAMRRLIDLVEGGRN